MARGTKISEFIKAISAQLEGKEWELPIIVKNDSNQWENFRISSTDLDEIISDESINIYNTDGSLPVIPDGGQPIERKMTLAGNALNIGDNLIVKENTIDFANWLRINKEYTVIDNINFRTASFYYEGNYYNVLKWVKKQASHAPILAVGEKTLLGSINPTALTGSFIQGHLAGMGATFSGNTSNSNIYGNYAFRNAIVNFQVTGFGTSVGENSTIRAVWQSSMFGHSNTYNSDVGGVTSMGAHTINGSSGNYITAVGIQTYQFAHGDENNVIGHQSMVYVTGNRNNVFGNQSHRSSNYSYCNIHGNSVSPTQNGHNIWGDLNSTKADFYGTPTFKALQQKGNLSTNASGDVYVKDELKPIEKMTFAQRQVLTPSEGMTILQTDYGAGLYCYTDRWRFMGERLFNYITASALILNIDFLDKTSGQGYFVSVNNSLNFNINIQNSFPYFEKIPVTKFNAGNLTMTFDPIFTNIIIPRGVPLATVLAGVGGNVKITITRVAIDSLVIESYNG